MNLTKNAVSEWLFLVFIHNMDAEEFPDTVNTLMNDLIRNGSSSIKVLLVVDSFSLNSGPEFKTYFQELAYEPGTDKFYFKDVTDVFTNDINGHFDFTKGKNWVAVLKHIKQTYQFNRTILLTLSHGAAVGLSPHIESTKNKLVISKSSVLFVPSKYFDLVDKQRRFVESEVLSINVNGNRTNYQHISVTPGNSCRKLEVLWISELADALKEGFGNRKIDLILMANCYMQTFDTGWLLRNQAEYLVAPETGMAADGYNLSALLQRLHDNPEINTAELARTIIPDLKKKWKDEGLDEYLDMLGIFANKLEYYPILKFFFEKISGQIIGCSHEEMLKIREIRDTYIQSVSNDPPDFGGDGSATVETVDLNHFFGLLLPVFQNNPSLKSHITIFCAITEMAVVCKHIGQGFVDHDKKYALKYNLNGISIFLPTLQQIEVNTRIINCAFFGTENIEPPGGVRDQDILGDFVSSSQWDEFIYRFFTEKEK